MGQVYDGLDGLFQKFHADLIEQNGKYNRHQAAQHDLADGNDQGIAENPSHIGQGKHILKMLQAHKFRS